MLPAPRGYESVDGSKPKIVKENVVIPRIVGCYERQCGDVRDRDNLLLFVGNLICSSEDKIFRSSQMVINLQTFENFSV